MYAPYKDSSQLPSSPSAHCTHWMTHIQRLNSDIPNSESANVGCAPVYENIIPDLDALGPTSTVAVPSIDVGTVRPVVTLVILKCDGARWEDTLSRHIRRQALVCVR